MNERQTKVQSLTERARQENQRPEAHPFRLGETYANRVGKYQVMAIAPPKMTIRYEDGGLVTADISILARIWSNLQMPPERPEPEPGLRRATKPATRPGPSRAAPRFMGLATRDFLPDASRSAWRGRLGPLIATRLSEISGIPHKAFPVQNRPVLYLGREHHFNGRFPEHRAKFMLRLTSEGVEYGFHVERDFQQMDLTWDWRRFIAALQESEPWGDQVRGAMLERGLEAEAQSYPGRIPDAGQEPISVGRWRATAEGLESSERASLPKACSWQDMAAALSGVDPSLKCGFYLLGRTPQAEAVESTEQLVERTSQTFAALMPLYSASAR